MADLISRLSPEVGIALCTLAASHGLTVEDVIIDIINGNFDVTERVFNVVFPERVGML